MDLHDTTDHALVALLRTLAERRYHFVTPTPLTHQRWLAARPGQVATTLREAFGWNLPFEPALLPAPLGERLSAAGIVTPSGEHLRSQVRVSSLAGRLYVHSPFPTAQAEAIFFGPDTYRFARFLEHELAARPPRPGARLLDVGCGSGAGGLVAAQHAVDATVVMSDINALALRTTAVNATAAGVEVELRLGDGLGAVDGDFDVVVCNPPYLSDDAERVYRHGGDRLGRALSLRLAEESLPRLRPGGRLLFYTGVAIVDGRDPFLEELAPVLEASGHAWRYEELDPDVFGEELERPAYRVADRIAVVGLVVERR